MIRWQRFTETGALSLLLAALCVLPAPAQQAQDGPERAWARSTKLLRQPDAVPPLRRDTPSPTRFTDGGLVLPPQNTPDVRLRPTTNTTQSEMSVAVDPLNPNRVLASANATNFPVSTIYGTGVYWSLDGGLTWSGFDQPPAGNGNSGDPAAVIDRDGRFFVGSIADNDGQGVMRSTDGGATWSYFQVSNPNGSLLDKNHFMVDNGPASPHQGNLYSAWTDFGQPDPNPIEFARSTNHGTSWVNEQNISGTIMTASEFGQGVNLQTGPQGEVYAAWSINLGTSPYTEQAIGFNRSTDGGVTWGSGMRAITNIRGIRATSLSPYNIRVNSFPTMGVSMATGAIYITWTNRGVPGVNTGDPDIYLIKSTDGGTTWSAPLRVNTDPLSNGANQWFPWMSVDPETDQLSIIFFDGRNHIGTNRVDVTVAHSADGGQTFENFAVNDSSFAVGPLPGFSGNYAGDYLGMAAGGARAYPVWNGQVPSTNSQGWCSPILYADPGDPNPPTGATAFSDFSTPTSMLVRWINPSTLVNGSPIDSFVTRIRRNGAFLTEIPGPDSLFVDAGLTDGAVYTYELVTRLASNDSLSTAVQTSWTAGGSPVPAGPTGLGVTGTSALGYTIRWTNPSRQVDGTRLDDLAGIRLFRDGSPVATLARTSADTGRADSTYEMPPPGLHSYFVRAVDNEVPENLSAASNTGFTPLEIPFTDAFPSPGTPNISIWNAVNVTVDDRGLNPTSPPYAMNLNGNPVANGDMVEVLSLDLSGLADSGLALSYFYQPKGNGDQPELADSLILEFKNSLEQWVKVRSYPGLATGAPVPPFAFEAVGVDGVNPGGGTFFYNGFRFRFRSKGTVGAFDDWFVDDVFFGIPTGAPNLGLSAIPSPSGQVANNAPLNPVVRVRNVSAVQASSFQVMLDLQGPGTSYSSSESGANLAAGESRDLVFSLPFTPDAAGLWTARAVVSVPGDPVSGNDTIRTSFYVVEGLTLPFTEEFPAAGPPDPLAWSSVNAEVTADGDGEPSAPYSLNLAGNPTGAGLDTVASLVIDLSGMGGTGVTLAYWQQPQGMGDAPETADSLITEGLNDQGIWIPLRKIPGAARRPFAFERFVMDSVSAGTGSFFHSGFKFRFRSRAQTGTNTPDDWFVDDVFFGIPTGTPVMAVSPASLGDTLLAGAMDSTSYLFTIRNNNPFAAPLVFTVAESPEVPWLEAAPASGSVIGGSAVAARLRVDFTGVVPGTFATSLVITGNDTANISDTVEVEFVVNAAPVVGVSPDSFSFALPGGDSVLAALTIRNTGLGPLTYASGVEGAYAGQTSDNIGNTENNLSTTSNLMRGGVVQVTTPVLLLEIRSYLDITTPRELRFVVYENTAPTGTFTKIFESIIPSSGTGVQFYSSGPINLELVAGKYYAVGVNWNGGLRYWWDASAPVPIPVSFGTITGGLAQSVFPPPATLNQTASSSLYYTQLVTASGRWLTVESGSGGTVAPGDSALVGFRIRTGLLPPGTVSASLVLNSNDPVAPRVTVPVSVDILTHVAGGETELPREFRLWQNYPNPFNPSTTIRFALPREARVRVSVYNLLGQEIRTLLEGERAAGYHTATWDGRNRTGVEAASGVYFYRMEAHSADGEIRFADLKKLILLR
ncbi:MAG: FlgD immunoglobulin-like domain containing protein [Bacteroidota bacterium]